MPLFPHNLVFFITDFETTGVDTSKDYPIEVGVVLADAELNKIGEFSSFISWPDLIDKKLDGSLKWKDQYSGAAEVHKIPAADYAATSISPATVASLILDVARPFLEMKKLILLSDNIQFEWQFMKRLMNETPNRVRVGAGRAIKNERGNNFTNWPFHYCGWDSSLFLEAVGIGDPPKDKKKHRALADAQQLQEYLKQAYNYVQKWRLR